MRGGRPGAGARGGQAGIDAGEDEEPSWEVGPGLFHVRLRREGLLSGPEVAGYPDLVRPLQQVTSSNKSPTSLQGMTAASGLLYRLNRMYLTPFYVPARSKLKAGHNYVTGGQQWKFCIYSCTPFGAYPSRLLWQSDVLAPPFTKVSNINLTLDRGWYWFGGAAGGSGSTSTMYMVNSLSCADLGMPSPTAMVASGLGNWALGAPSALAGWWRTHLVAPPDINDRTVLEDPFPAGTHPHANANDTSEGAIGLITDAGGQLYPTLYGEWSAN